MAVSGSTPIGAGLESEEISQSSHASQSSANATPSASSQAPLKIKITKKKKRKSATGRGGGKRSEASSWGLIVLWFWETALISVYIHLGFVLLL